MIQYERSQSGRALLWGLLGITVLVLIAGIAALEHPEIFILPVVILLITAIAFRKLTTRIDNGILRACFGSGLICKTVSLDQIAVCEPIKIRWWYGWGIHLTPYGWLYNISGWEAVAITLAQRPKVRARHR